MVVKQLLRLSPLTELTEFFPLLLLKHSFSFEFLNKMEDILPDFFIQFGGPYGGIHPILFIMWQDVISTFSLF